MMTETYLDNSIKNEFILSKTTNEDTKITTKQKSKNSLIEINYVNYFKKIISLKAYKIPELKSAAKQNKLHVTGPKQVLIERIETHFNKVKHAIIIQKIFRGQIVRRSFILRGPAIRDRTICVNDADYVTMEPLAEIEDNSFFSYTDEKNFTYGFNIISLIQSIQKQHKVLNPYNREKLNDQIIANIKSLFQLSLIIYPEFKLENESYALQSRCKYSNSRNVRNYNAYATNTARTNVQTNVQTNHYRHAPFNVTLDAESNARRTRIVNIQNLPVDQRIQNLFMEIDQLGNYTQSEWFSTLSNSQYIRLYRVFYEIWNYRGQLSREVRSKIYPYGNIFDGIFPRTPYYNDLSQDQIKIACLVIFENMVYSGIDEDHRKLGALHALTALTVISTDARNALPWLYESIAY